jgi:hypothetical protein
VQELLKSWKEFEATPDAKTVENQQNGPTLEIRIPAKFVTSTNRQVSVLKFTGDFFVRFLVTLSIVRQVFLDFSFSLQAA